MLGNAGRGGGGFLPRGGGAHYGPADRGRGRGKGGGRGGGKGSKGGGSGGKGGHNRQAGHAFSVRVPLGFGARARVIGPGGSIVKGTEKKTKTSIRLPSRDALDGTPTVVSGATPYSVLSACRMLAHQIFDVTPDGGYRCTCRVAGGSEDLHSVLRRPAGQPWLFEPSGGNAGDHDASAFAAVALQVAELAPSPDAAALALALDDVLFSCGAADLPLHAATSSERGDRVFYLFALGGTAWTALREALPGLCARLSAGPLPLPLVDTLPWEAERSRAALSTVAYVAQNGRLQRGDAEGFRAAGVLLWRRDLMSGEPLVLMAYETRKDARRFNFLGGKRDHPKESPEVVAARECWEETDGHLSQSGRRRMEDGMRPAAWAPDSKYALFLHEAHDAEAPMHLEALPMAKGPRQRTLRWCTMRQLLDDDWLKANCHEFAVAHARLVRAELEAILTAPHVRLVLRPAPDPQFPCAAGFTREGAAPRHVAAVISVRAACGASAGKARGPRRLRYDDETINVVAAELDQGPIAVGDPGVEQELP